MDNIIPENEITEVEGRVYVNPQTGIDEANTFIENLRNTQQANTQQIAQDTYNLGTAVPSNLGGLTGGTGYWTSRYQIPQTNAVVANLRATAQAQALNDVLANEQAIWKNRYQQAYRNYQKRQSDRSNSYYSGGTADGGAVEGGVEYEANDSGDREVYSVEPSYSPAGSGTYYFTPNSILKENSNNILNNGNSLVPQNSLFASGEVNIDRDKFGNITSLTYNGKTFTGDAAKKKYDALQSVGTISSRK